MNGQRIEESPRGLPCNVVPADQLYCIVGQDGQGGGVIEWCTDENDAISELTRLQSDTTGRYRDLRYGRIILWSWSKAEM